jgi:hypothetical protein
MFKLLLVIAVLVVITTTTLAYAQQSMLYIELNAKHQAFVKQILQETFNRLMNETADGIHITDDGTVHITWDESFKVTAPDGNVVEIPREITLTTLHNFTAGRGYDFTGSAIIAPNGTELFGTAD